MKDELHLHETLKYAADMQRLEKQGYRFVDIDCIIEKLEDKALEHEKAGHQFGTDRCYGRAEEEFLKSDGIKEAIEIINEEIKENE